MIKKEKSKHVMARNKKDKMNKNKRKNNKNNEEVPKAVRQMEKERKERKNENKVIDEQLFENVKTGNKRRKKEKKNKKSKIKKYIILLLLIIIVIIMINMLISAARWAKIFNDMTINQNSIVLDNTNKQIGKIGSERITIKVDNMPEKLKQAYVSIEDERFYKHHGIDIKRTTSAIASYIIHFGKSSFGGSSITQQLVKNYTGDSTDSIKRKVNEWYKAIILETQIEKDDILNNYLNIIYVGPNMYGAATGAKYYFNKDVNNLSIEENAFLAGINHSPNSYNPFKENIDKIELNEKINKRTTLVLNKMKELNYITEAEHKEAKEKLDKGLEFNQGQIPHEESVFSYHTDAMISEVTKDIQNKYKISENFAENYLTMSGAKIYTTQDTKIQNETEKEFNNKRYQLKSKTGQNHSEAAMVIIDHKTGKVLSCVGGLGKKETARPFNRATQSIRQTGSAMKPLCVLAPAIEEKIITPATIIDDKEQDFTTEFQNDYHPTDYNGTLGKITVRRATESSQNIPFVKIMEQLTPEKSIEYLEKMGITTLTNKDKNLPLALGGLEKGISPMQMASAYAMIANDGIYINPTFYNKVERHNGKLFIKAKQKKKRVISKQTAFIVKEILTEPVLGNNGTATYCKIKDMEVAAKTGTTDENYDRWLCGFTPYYTAATWFGYDQNESIHFNGKNPAGLIWSNVMKKIHNGMPKKEFEMPKNIISTYICKETGMQATINCKDYYNEYFIKGTEPNMCNKHTGNIRPIDKEEHIIEKRVEMPPSEFTEDYYIENNDLEDNKNIIPNINDKTKDKEEKENKNNKVENEDKEKEQSNKDKNNNENEKEENNKENQTEIPNDNKPNKEEETNKPIKPIKPEKPIEKPKEEKEDKDINNIN